jgi:hypothetical protein
MPGIYFVQLQQILFRSTMVPSNLPMDYGAGETSSPQEEPPMPYQCESHFFYIF